MIQDLEVDEALITTQKGVYRSRTGSVRLDAGARLTVSAVNKRGPLLHVFCRVVTGESAGREVLMTYELGDITDGLHHVRKLSPLELLAEQAE